VKRVRRKSISFRLTLLFASTSSLVLLLLGVLIGNSVERHFEEQDLGILAGKLQLTQHALEKLRAPADLEILPQQLEGSLVGHAGVVLVIVAADGRTLFATAGARFPPALLDRSVEPGALSPVRWQSADGQPFRGLSALLPTGIAGAPPVLVAVATEISHHEHFMSDFRATLWTFMVLAAWSIGLLGWIAVRRELAPLQAIKREAAAITAQRLNARLPINAVPVELVALAETLNEMLARLEESFRQLSDFSSYLAHELRTPVSNLLTQTQVMLAKGRSCEEYQEVLASNAEELERLSRMISDMLFLAKADNSLIIPHREQVDLRVEVQSLLEFYEAFAEEKKVTFSCSGRALVSGDRLMLRRAINNLLSNAIRHTPAGGGIAVRLTQADETRVRLAVENTGETIAAEHLPRLFDPFYRADASRQRFSDGAGLGLAITRSILHAHGGTVDVRSENRLTVFELSLPGQPQARSAV
jgi:two-component system heavy metal sensor histidine kinase CusS